MLRNSLGHNKCKQATTKRGQTNPLKNLDKEEDAKKEVPTLVVPKPKLILRDSILLHPQEPKPLIESTLVEGPTPYLNMQQSPFTQEFDHIAFIDKAMELNHLDSLVDPKL